MSRRIVVYSLLLGAVTSIVIGMTETNLPNSQVKDAVLVVFAMPGVLLTMFIWPEGPHSEYGAAYWGLGGGRAFPTGKKTLLFKMS